MPWEEKMVRVAVCNRCGHKWEPSVEKPVLCPGKSCKSPYWDRERVYRLKSGKGPKE